MQYTWAVKQLNVLPTYNGYFDVVYSIGWSLTGEENGFVAQTEGAVLTKIDEITRFTNYSDLTENEVLSWVFELLGNEEKTNTEVRVQQVIQSLENKQQVVTQPLPWDK